MMGLGISVKINRDGGRSVSIILPDFTVTNDAEWDALFIAGDPVATLSGKSVGVSGSNFTKRSVTSIFTDFVEIVSVNSGSSLPGLWFKNSSKIRCNGLNIVNRAWPKDLDSLVRFEATNSEIDFNSCDISHAYGNPTDARVIANGGNPVTIDTAQDLPEYNRIDNVATCGQTSANVQLAWQDTNAPNWTFITLFNRDTTNSVFVKLGVDNTVVATNADTEILPGSNLRLSKSHYLGSSDKSLPVYIAYISDAGTPEFNARTEIGLGTYLARAFGKDGGGTLSNCKFTNNTVYDVTDGFKFGISGDMLFDRNVVQSCYQDAFSFSTPDITPTSLQITRNEITSIFARSGTSEAGNGDAGDPHGDVAQLFGQDNVEPYTPNDWGNIMMAGNYHALGSVRTGVSVQDLFISDMPATPDGVYSDVYLLGNIGTGGPGRGLTLAAKDFYIRGNTNVTLGVGTSACEVYPILDTLGFLADNIMEVLGQSATTEAGDTVTQRLEEGNILLPAEAAHTDVFVDFTIPATITELKTKYATKPAGIGNNKGAFGVDQIDFDTADTNAVIKWANIPARWRVPSVANVALSDLVETIPGKVMGGDGAIAVAVDVGTAWQSSTNRDGSGIISAWSTVAGTIQRGEFLRVRGISSSANATTVALGVTLGGNHVPVDITTLSTAFDNVTLDGDDHLARSGAIGSKAAAQKFVFAHRGTFGAGSPSNARVMKINSNKFDVYLNNYLSQARIDIGAGLRFRVTGAQLSATLPQTFILTVDTTKDTVEEGVVAYLDGTRLLTFTNVTWIKDRIADLTGVTTATIFTGISSDQLHGQQELVYFDAPDTLPDITNAATRNLFNRDFLGVDGSGPTGAQPLICMHGDAANWVAGTNRGSISDFTSNGNFVTP